MGKVEGKQYFLIAQITAFLIPQPEERVALIHADTVKYNGDFSCVPVHRDLLSYCVPLGRHLLGAGCSAVREGRYSICCRPCESGLDCG